jgi:hypothetical protein
MFTLSTSRARPTTATPNRPAAAVDRPDPAGALFLPPGAGAGADPVRGELGAARSIGLLLGRRRLPDRHSSRAVGQGSRPQELRRGGNPFQELATLIKFETDIIDALMDVHQIAPEDRPLVLKYARTPVRGAMVAKLLAIAQTKAADRTDEEKILYNWFQARVWKNEKKRIDSAIAEYNRWYFDACDYTLDRTSRRP